jgi:RimJ/RimL family protein N-acetyltransferase
MASTTPFIRIAGLEDRELEAFARFVAEHLAESGVGGSIPFAISRKVARDEVRTNAVMRWSKTLEEPNWGRAWLLWAEQPARIVGHLELKGGRLPAEMHRASLGMGMLRAYTGQGWGGKLIETAVAWSKRVAKLDWIDLGVFSHNLPARKLYRRMGFVEQGLRPDAFHIDGMEHVDDVLMTLDLRSK